MNERLEEIKRKFNYNHGKSYWKVVAVERKDVEWLIGQAEVLGKARKELDRDASMSYIFHKIEQLLDGEHNE